MTGHALRLCRIMCAVAVLATSCTAIAFACAACRDVQSLRRAETYHWQCARKSSDSCRQVTAVGIAHPYALVGWRTVHSGGETLWKNARGTWVAIADGGGQMAVSDLQHYGVPRDLAAQLVEDLTPHNR